MSQPALTISPLDLVLSDTAEMPVRHPLTRTPLTMPDGSAQVLYLTGADSAQFRRELAKAEAKTGAKAAAKADKAAADPDAEVAAQVDEAEAFSLALVAACTVGWRLLGPDGAELPYSAEAALELYTRLPWLRQDADRFMARREHFLGNA